MEKLDYLSLGSIVLLKGGTQKLLIIGRGLKVKNEEKHYFFDYAAVAYPDGIVGDKVAYFNHDNISRVVFRGYTDVEDENLVDTINQYLSEDKDVIRGDVSNWNKN